MSIDLQSITLHGALQSLEKGEFTTAELIREMFIRIGLTEDDLQSWVEMSPRAVMDHAFVADRRRRLSTPVAPLFGVPIGVKDIIDVAGIPTRCNMASRRDAEAAIRDADVVHALRRDGAIIVGKTVTQEAAAGVVSDPARNPWDPERIPGGSSGGSAAAVAAGTCLGALGTDTGGSIRIPASLTGTVGLKPTYGRLGLKGIFPLSPSLDTVGPIARTVLDAAMMYLSLAGRPKEIPSLGERYGASGGTLAGTRIGVVRTFFHDRLQADVSIAFEQAVATLEGLGAEVIECEWREADVARSVAMLISRAESAAVHRDALRHAPGEIGEALRSRIELGAVMPADTYIRARQVRVGIRRSIADVYIEHQLDAVVVPTLPATAASADDLRVEYGDTSSEEVGAAMTRLTQPWNATGQPVISVPCGFDVNRLPIGLSFVGRPDQELELCDIAHAYERAAGWYRHWPELRMPAVVDETSE